jgi:hypothetical protein
VQLPDDNSIVLAADNDAFVADGSEMPAPTIDDVRALLPAYAQEGDDTPTRAGVLQAFRGLANLLWARIGLVLSAQRSPRHASGAMLDWWGPLFGRFRAVDEGDPQYRQRLLTPTQMVTPTAIKGAIDALVAPFTTQKVNYQEPALDAMFMAPASATDPPKPNATIVSNVVPAWHAYIQPVGVRLWANYPDRPNVKTGAYLVPVPAGAHFWVTFPGQPSDASGAPHVAPLSAAPSWYSKKDFIGGITGQSGPHQSIVAGTPSAAAGGYGFTSKAVTSLIDQVLSELEQRRGGGVSAAVLIDPLFLSGK